MDKDIDKLYAVFDFKLDNIAEKILLSKVNDNDDVLFRIASHIENVFIRTALKITDDNISKASKLLGINRNTLSKRIREFSNNGRK